jgi:hypothetical protein
MICLGLRGVLYLFVFVGATPEDNNATVDTLALPPGEFVHVEAGELLGVHASVLVRGGRQ